MEFNNNNTGVLFKNRSENDKAPGYTGKITIDGHEYDLAAWVKTGKSGEKFFSLKVQEPRAKKDPAPKAKTPASDPFDDSDIPF